MSGLAFKGVRYRTLHPEKSPMAAVINGFAINVYFTTETLLSWLFS
jgi:hypothetical protein